MTTKAKKNPHRGSSLDDLLKEEGVFEEFQAAAIKNVIAFQLSRAIEDKHLTKTQMASRMKTSRAQLNRLLDPKDGNVTLETLQKAAAILGRELKVELI
ncbi:helix-turn-helix domain-containing protein [Hyphomicrobium sp.]|uniref:helix-turn-helix domain-containing protein n=1 Tax=Hyphomicrobium sp. TaxID=82 RepID=UPI003F7293F9